MKHRRFIALMVGAALMLAGCWNRREVNEVAIASALAIDRENEQELRVTVQLLAPHSAGEGQEAEQRPRTFLVTATGRTVFDALRNVNQVVSRRPEWKHNNAIVFSEEIARQGLGELLDFFIRDHESRLDQWILISHGKAAEVLVPHFQLEPSQGVGLRRLNLNVAMSSAKSVEARLYDFVLSLTEDGGAPVAAAAETVEAGDPAKPQETNRRVRIRGAAVFKGDKLAGWLSEQEIRGLQWARGRVASTIVTVPCKQGSGPGISIEIDDAKVALRPQWRQGGQLAVQVQIRASGKLGELACKDDLSKPAALVALQQRTARMIETEISASFRRLQGELGADPAGIGKAVERAFPAAWKRMKPRWSELYPKVEIIPLVTVELLQTGTAAGKPLSGGE